ncbi:MAG: hypothetical protein HKN92_10865 [Chitinophagales bacterium]|nr:hypothetical protein [Chitinophagales bacterium]
MRTAVIICLLAIISLTVTGADITFNVLYPAAVQVDQKIKKIALIDRSLSSDKKSNIIEGILTGEGIGQDKLSSQIALDGMMSILQSSARYEVIRTPEVMKTNASGGQLPEPLSWQEIVRLCSKYRVDAIVSLETFDSDYIITPAKKIGESGFSAKGSAVIHLGFRMYNPKNKSIADQLYYDHRMNWSATKPSITEAAGALIDKNSAIKEVSYAAGCKYARRISPSYYKVTREYFKRGKKDDDLAEGARMMEANDWKQAITALERSILNGHKKSKGKAAHNLAVVYEIIGDLERSKKYATMAWGKYKNKPSKDYAYQITKRMNQQFVLDEQLGMR